MYTPLTIANTVISMRPGQSPMWLNKIVYMIHGWSLAHDRSVVGDLPQVWRYGPAYASLYDALRHFGSEPVNSPQPIRNGSSMPMVPESDTDTLSLIQAVLERYGHFTAVQLSSVAHAPGSPWQLEAKANGFQVEENHQVPEWRLRDHYKGLLAEHHARQAA